MIATTMMGFASDFGGSETVAMNQESTLSLVVAVVIGFVAWLIVAAIAAVPMAIVALVGLATRVNGSAGEGALLKRS
jgi:hypothetical protein